MELSNQPRHDNLPHDFAMEGTAKVNVEAQSAAVGTQSTINFTSQDGTLTITGTEDALGKHIQIDISTQPSPVAPLVANLSVSPTNGVTPWTVTADASLSSGAVPIRTYAWNWGDGNTTAAGPAKTATHTYTTAGTYTVTVTVVDANGVTKTASKTVVSNGPATGGVDLVVTGVSASPSSPVAGDAVTFTVTVKNNGTVAVPAGTGVGQNIGVGFYLDGARPPTAPITFTNSNAGLAAGASATLTTTTGWAPGGTWAAVVGAHTITAFVDDSASIVEVNNSNNTLDMTLSVAPAGTSPDVVDRGSTVAITAGTVLDSGTFSPAPGSLLVVVVEGTTI